MLCQLFHLISKPLAELVAGWEAKWPIDYIHVATLSVYQPPDVYSCARNYSTGTDWRHACSYTIDADNKSYNLPIVSFSSKPNLRGIRNGDVVVCPNGEVLIVDDVGGSISTPLKPLPKEMIVPEPKIKGYKLRMIKCGGNCIESIEKVYSVSYPHRNKKYTNGKSNTTVQEYLQNFVDQVNSGNIIGCRNASIVAVMED